MSLKRFLISNFLASADIKVFGRTYLFTMLLLIGLALFLHPGCFCLACVITRVNYTLGIIMILFYITVPIPNVTVTAPNTQTVGQSLTLQCEVTTVRGITSRVDIVWSSGGDELQRMENVSSTTMDNSLVYTDSYTISQLSTTDEGRVIQCEVVINISPSVIANDNITLDVTGEY